jgi:hypothetical protein
VRSRCQRYAFPAPAPLDPRAPGAPQEARALAARFDRLARAGLVEILDWAEEYRGARGAAAGAVTELLATAAAWLRADVARAVAGAGEAPAAVGARLAAFREIQACRKALAQRNANPQMVAERALLALREASL